MNVAIKQISVMRL